MTHKLIVLRHGESQWNKENKFCGWTDIPLSDQGILEAHHVSQLLDEAGLQPDIMYTSKLTRTIQTGTIIVSDLNKIWMDQYKIWQLNERHYGAYQGLDKHEVFLSLNLDAEKYKYIRRNYHGLPPLIEGQDPTVDERYKYVPIDEIPRGESLEMVIKRVIPYLRDEIITKQMLEQDKVVIVVTHGSVVRSIIKYLTNVNNEDISNINIPTGIPIIFEINDDGGLARPYYYLNKELADKGIEKVKNEGLTRHS